MAEEWNGGTVTTNDGAVLVYDSAPPDYASTDAKTCILLLHGFSGSAHYFRKNRPELAKHHWVIAPDMRGHGRSSHTEHGFHVARLAMDLHDIVHKCIRRISSECRIYAVGCSIGAAVLWTYTELFTDVDFDGFIFVDQGPLQDRSMFGNWGPGLAHYGCYDEATMLAAQKAWSSKDQSVREQTYIGLVDSCLGYRYKRLPSDKITESEHEFPRKFFTELSRSCDGVWLAKLLADHTRYDHREAIELIRKPIMVMIGQRSGCFSEEAQLEITTRWAKNRSAGTHEVANCVRGFASGHWLFWEEPEKFNEEVLAFVRRCEKASHYMDVAPQEK